MNAKKARQLTQQGPKSAKERFLQDIYKRIALNTEKGLYNISITKHCYKFDITKYLTDKNIHNNLQSNGYFIDYLYSYNDFFESYISGIKISWTT